MRILQGENMAREFGSLCMKSRPLLLLLLVLLVLSITINLIVIKFR